MNNIKSFSTPQETAQSLALYLKDKINTSKTFYLAISGGSTPKMLFEALTNIKTEIAWNKLQLYWVDERCVTPDHPESNYLMTFNSLLSNVLIPKANIHRMKGELTPEDGLKDYEKEMETLPTSEGLPQFDLIILGMGNDGHTASIFPPYKELITVASNLAIGTNPYSGQKRLTLTGRTIKNAKDIIFHITGAKKASVLNEILNKKGDFENYPSYAFIGEKTTWWVDHAALGK